MRKLGASAGIRITKGAVVQPKGSSYAGKAGAKNKPTASAAPGPNQINLTSTNKSGKIVCDSYDCNPFRADKELSRRIR